MIPLAVPNLNGNEREYLNKCIDTTFVSSVGEFVGRMEEMSAELSGCRYGVATSSGTTGLHLALMGVGVERDDLVIVPTYTFIATANAVAHCGALPWLFDMNQDDWCIDVNLIEKALDSECKMESGKVTHIKSGRRVAAIMPVYVLGNIPDMEKINAIAQKYKLPVVADAACAIGAEYNGNKTGDLAALSVFSFNGNKTVTAGGGGVVVGNDEMLMKKIKHISTTARVTAEYDFDMVGYNYRMTNIQAAVGVAQLEQLHSFLKRKKDIRQYYKNALEDIKGISIFPATEGSSCWFSGMVLPDGKSIRDVRRVIGKLKEKGIEARSFWKPVHLQPPYASAPRTAMENADRLWDRMITLPCSTGITDEELESVCKAIYELCRG